MSSSVNRAPRGSPHDIPPNSDSTGGGPVTPTAAVLLGLLLLGPAPTTPGDRDEGAMTGWQLHETVQASVGAFWNITRSQIYVELGRLAADGLLDEHGDRGPRRQRRYKITEQGRVAFEKWINALARDEARPDQLRSPLTLLVFFGEHIPAPLLRRALQDHHLMRERRLEQLNAMLAVLDSRDARRLPTSVLRRGIGLARLQLEWIDDVLQLLQDA